MRTDIRGTTPFAHRLRWLAELMPGAAVRLYQRGRYSDFAVVTITEKHPNEFRAGHFTFDLFGNSGDYQIGPAATTVPSKAVESLMEALESP